MCNFFKRNVRKGVDLHGKSGKDELEGIDIGENIIKNTLYENNLL